MSEKHHLLLHTCINIIETSDTCLAVKKEHSRAEIQGSNFNRQHALPEQLLQAKLKSSSTWLGSDNEPPQVVHNRNALAHLSYFMASSSIWLQVFQYSFCIL